MRDAQGRRAIRLGDTTDHGGIVKTALQGLTVHGIAAAGEGNLVRCPKCKSDFRIVATVGGGRRHHGVLLAYEGDRTECGAMLIASVPG
jgi:uncharacterized Zn-binding protein involved in type VI secretion